MALFYIYAAALLGMILVPLNVRWSAAELQRAVEDCGAEVAVCESTFLDAIRGARSLTAVIVLFGDPHHHHTPFIPSAASPAPPRSHSSSSSSSSSSTIISHEELVCQHIPLCRPDPMGGQLDGSGSADVHCLIYTSGSTGEPKGVMLTHSNQLCQAEEKCRVVGYDETTVYLNLAPLFHIGGLNSTLAVTMAGGTHVFLTSRMDMDVAVEAIVRCHVNTLVVVPAILHALLTCRSLQQPGGAVALSGVRMVLVGGQSMSSRLEALASRLLPHARFIQTYACSEACSSITFLDLGRGSQLLLQRRQREEEGGSSDGDGGMGTCVGLPASHAEVRIIVSGGGEGKGGSVGEIVTRAPHVMKGYWGKEALTARALRGGWLHTGDLGYLDEKGRLWYCGRVADVIRSGGESVYAMEVERVVERHPRVAQVAVYGVPDERLGEKAVAAVVLLPRLPQSSRLPRRGVQGEDGAASIGGGDGGGVAGGEEEEKEDLKGMAEEIKSFCREQGLGRYKCPREIVFMKTLPRNTTGKVVKGELVKRWRSFL